MASAAFFSKSNFSPKKIFFEYNQSVKQFRSRSGSELFAKVISRRNLWEISVLFLKVYDLWKFTKYETCAKCTGFYILQISYDCNNMIEIHVPQAFKVDCILRIVSAHS